MVSKILNATEIKKGTNIIVEGVPCMVKKVDISKTGKHGHAKVRIEATGIVNGQKKVFVVPGHERFNVPIVDKRKAQVLSIEEGKASIMDLENYETIESEVPEDIKNDIEINSNVEYWDIEGEKIIKRLI